MIRPGDPPDEPELDDDDPPKIWGVDNYPTHIPMGLPLPSEPTEPEATT